MATTRSIYLKGVRDGGPFVLIVVPFAALFGVVGSEAGLSIAQVMCFSVLVIAGAAQFTAVQLMLEEAPTVIVLATSLAVNLRMAMYSASLVPHLGAAPFWQRGVMAYLLVDQSYAISIVKFDAEPDMPLAQKVAYFLGVVTLIVPFWYGFTLAGAMAGRGIPDSWALDFAVPLAFLSLVAPALRTLAHVAAAFVAVVLGLALAGLPYSIGLLIAAVAAMATGSELERRGYGT
ncbi:MAG: AzlC family ABC transporter permease [Pseudomonadota bacterium]